MTTEQILEGNKLIAEFFTGETFFNHSILIHGFSEESNLFFDSQLKFHSSWDWLMPCVQKIEELDRLGGIVTIIQGQCTITSRMAGDHTVMANKSHYMLMGAKGKLLATYEAVVEFIKWYNKHKEYL